LMWDMLHNIRRLALGDAIKDRFPYRHVPPKPTAWQGPYRKTSRDYFALCNARNTGIAYARGSYIIFFDDCSVLDEAFLHRHALCAARGNIAMAGGFTTYQTAKVVQGRIIEGEKHPGIDTRGDRPARTHGGHMWGLNFGAPLEAFLKTNGNDEKFDGQGGSEDSQAGVRIERAGYQIIHDPHCKVYQILDTHDEVCGFQSCVWPTGQPQKQKELVLKADGKPHYANEKLIEQLFEDPERTWTQGNDFDLRELRTRVLRDGYAAFNRVPSLTHDWRDGQPLEEM